MKWTPIDSAAAIVRGRDLARGFRESFDAVVVGSGSGGMPAATILAEAGWRVLLLEEGGYYTPDELATFPPTEAIRRTWREAGLLAAVARGKTPLISVAMGRCVGGSSVLTGAVCFRVPSEVHESWERDLGLDKMSEEDFEPHYREVEERIGVEDTPPEMRSYATRRFVEGAESLGIAMKSIRRNVRGCQGNGQCNTGCPVKAKQSVDIAYLPKAVESGLRVVSDALVEKVLVKGGRAVGVRGHLLDGQGGRTFTFQVDAPVVVLACGTIHTPLLLMKSGYRDPGRHLGRGITLHPSVRMTAEFDEPVDGHVGAMQAVYSDHFSNEGLTIIGVQPPPHILAAGLPGLGPSHRRLVRRMRAIGSIGGMIHDEGGGQVYVGPGREPVLTYRMHPRDLQRLRRLATVLGEIAFAAGAKRVYPAVFGVDGIDDVGQLRALEHADIEPRRIESMAFHPLGSARMSDDPRAGVVDQDGQVHGTKGLFIADGSVVPTSIGVNSQVAILAVATKIAHGIVSRLERPKDGRIRP